jgi:hypothetical protein
MRAEEWGGDLGGEDATDDRTAVPSAPSDASRSRRWEFTLARLEVGVVPLSPAVDARLCGSEVDASDAGGGRGRGPPAVMAASCTASACDARAARRAACRGARHDPAAPREAPTLDSALRGGRPLPDTRVERLPDADPDALAPPPPAAPAPAALGPGPGPPAGAEGRGPPRSAWR